LITWFLLGKGNPTTTSTIFSPFVDHVMEENRIEYFNELRGETPNTNRGRGAHKGQPNARLTNGGGVAKTVGVTLLRVLNDLLPYKLRPIKTKRRRLPGWYGVAHEWYTWRMVWTSHHRPALVKRIKQLNYWRTKA
jgi:hypothetical protein